MANNEFLQNIKDIETALFASESFKYLQKSQLGQAEIGGVIAEIYKQAVSGALNLEEIKLKERAEAVNLEKAKMELELGKEQLKAQIKQAQSEALKSLIQAKSMVRSVTDNARIQRANAYVGLGNVIANAENLAALTQGDLIDSATNQSTGKGITGLASLNIEFISTDTFNEFDDLLKNMIDDVNFIGKDIMIFSPRVIIAQGENISLTGLTSYEGKTSFWLDDGSVDENGEKIGFVKVGENLKNYLFFAENLGEFIVKFQINGIENEEYVEEVEVEKKNSTTGEVKMEKEKVTKTREVAFEKSDSISLKVVKNLGKKELPALKHF